jgi:hypothetical protein
VSQKHFIKRIIVNVSGTGKSVSSRTQCYRLNENATLDNVLPLRAALVEKDILASQLSAYNWQVRTIHTLQKPARSNAQYLMIHRSVRVICINCKKFIITSLMGCVIFCSLCSTPVTAECFARSHSTIPQLSNQNTSRGQHVIFHFPKT